MEVLLVAGGRRHRHVQDRLRLILRPPRTGIERPLVERDVEDARIVPEDRLGSVAVVNVPVENRDPPQLEVGLGVARRDRDVVEEAKPHRPLAERMVTRRPGQREAGAVDRVDRCSGREQCGLEACLRHVPRMMAVDMTGVDPEFSRGGVRHGQSPLPVNAI